MASNSKPNSDPKVGFFNLFTNHWHEGTGRPIARDIRYRNWTVKEFADSMERNGCPISDDAVRIWFRGKSLPRSTQKAAILRVFFPEAKNGLGATEADQQYVAMDKAWQEAQSQPRPPPNRAPHVDKDTPISPWTVSERIRAEGLAVLRLHPPRPGNVPETYYVDMTLAFSTAECEYEGRTVLIALRNAFLSINSSNYQPAFRSLVGERAEHPNFKPRAEGVEIIGPLDSDGSLTGNPLGEEYLAIIERTEGPQKPVTVRLHASRRSFAVVELAPVEATIDAKSNSVNKDVILNQLIYEGRAKDGQGQVIIAEARMRRREGT